MRAVFLVLSLTACVDKGGDSAVEDDGLDQDHDGYVTDRDGATDDEGNFLPGGDCDDLDPAVNPAADELCDDIDNDCDGLVNEDNAVDATLYYFDYDEDGYGDLEVTATSCSPLDRYVTNSDDCDDNEPAAHPGGAEVCTPEGEDAIDEDCDGEIDEEC